VAQRTERTLDVQLVEGVDEALAPAALAVSVSGTASLEAALAGVPTVVIYKMRPSTHMVARLLVRTPFIAMANVVHGGELFPELIQNDVTAAGIVGAAARVLERAEAIKPALHQLAVTLAPELDPAPAVRAAELLLETWPESLEN
jgi:lipid-A-disaccharide synthase